jgi:5-methylthioadenosine/S-adenosylhomocysteine deaminase
MGDSAACDTATGSPHFTRTSESGYVSPFRWFSRLGARTCFSERHGCRGSRVTTATSSGRHRLKSLRSILGGSGVRHARRARGACEGLVVVATVLLGTLSPVSARGGSYTLQGTLLTPKETIEGGSLTVQDGKILQVGKRGAPGEGPTIDVQGVIMPGMIDLHDHLTWNVFPQWKPGRLFENRYEWEESAEYSRALKDPEASLISGGLGCDADLFGEVKALAGGATSVVGSYAGRRDHPGENACIEGLTRSLDFYPELGKDGDRAVAYEIFPFEVAPERMDLYRHHLTDGSLACLLIHVAEGSPTDASAHREFRMLKAQVLLRKGVAVIHGVVFRQEDFRDMAANGVALVWSPRSNYELYGATTRIEEARRAGVTIALAPDWSPTGSAGMLQELRYVAKWNQHNKVFQDGELIELTTSTPAEVAGFGSELGTLAPGRQADLLVLKSSNKSASATVLSAGPADVELVVVGGTPLYGDARLMAQLLAKANLEALSICGVQKALYMGDTPGAGNAAEESFAKIRQRLDDALRRSGTALGPFECQ